MSNVLSRGAIAAAALFAASTAFAHVVLERSEAPAGSSYRAVLRVAHGCKGSPTTSLTVRLPDGAVGARPMAKPGWSIAALRGPYDRPYPGPHGVLTEGVREITWSGGSLADDLFDEFVFQVALSEAFRPGDVLHFPVEQTCANGSYRWVETPAPGQSSRDLTAPAPSLRIVVAEAKPSAQAGSTTKAGDLVIDTPWLRATPGGAAVAGGYVKVTNAGTAPDRLVGTSIPLAERGEVHEMSVENGVMKMRAVEGIAIAPGATIELKPGGFHLMFLGLKGGLKEGETVRGTLVFEKAGAVEVSFKVGGIGARGAPASGGEHRH